MAQVVVNIDTHTPVNLVKGTLRLVFWPLKQVNNVILDATDVALMQRRLERIEQLQAQAEREAAEEVAAAAAEVTEETPIVTTNVKVRRARKPVAEVA
jgi:hypothetical protein